MKARQQTGFSLIEALVSVLVLSIGLVSLAQLQARLWSAAGDRHSTGLAYQLAVSELDRSLYSLSTASVSGASSTREFAGPSARFRATTTTTADPVAPSSGTLVEWDDRSGSRSIHLHTGASPAPAADLRWLLPTAGPAVHP
ncbi:MAG: prepilin-type N-terminal cleavage/methylation domain-containing protein [Thiogranum sp.]|nr:prepilin-type N-terminal cleavage/methylation domain-containing protein [Thiogranum sp.]